MSNVGENLAKVHKILGEMFIDPKSGRPFSGGRLAKGSWGSQIIDELKPPTDGLVVPKRRPSAFYQTDLELTLRSWGARTLIMTGITAEVCVESTARDAFMRDFDIIFVSDATAAWDRRRHEGTLNNARYLLGFVASSDEVMRLFKR